MSGIAPSPACVWLSLGSNAPGAAARVAAALRALRSLPRTRVTRVSGLYLTSPVGRTVQPIFVNAAAAIETGLSPMGLLTECKRLEAAAGRRPGPRWGPRPLDVDILLYGTARLRTPFLTIPHPLAGTRRFVLAPLAEIAPRLRLPGSGDTARLALRRLKDPSQSVKLFAPAPRR